MITVTLTINLPSKKKGHIREKGTALPGTIDWDNSVPMLWNRE